MFAPVLLGVLAAAGGPLKLALPDIHAVHVDAQAQSFYSEHLAQQMKLLGADVVTTREIGVLLGMERQRQLLGCSDENSCMAELADALGATGVVLVDIARLDDGSLQLNVKVVSNTAGKTLGAWSDRVQPDAAIDALSRAAQVVLMQSYRAQAQPPPDALVDSFKSPLEKLFWAPLAVGFVAAGVGLGLYLWAGADYRALTVPGPELLTESQARARRDGGKLKEPLGAGLLIGGGVAMLAGVAMLVTGKLTATDVAVIGFAPLADGGGLVVSGAWW